MDEKSVSQNWALKKELPGRRYKRGRPQSRLMDAVKKDMRRVGSTVIKQPKEKKYVIL